jgi:alpha-galactosidase
MSDIFFDAQDDLWILSTPATSYAFTLDSAQLVHLYWGVPLAADSIRALASSRPVTRRHLDDVGSNDEIAAAGGARFGTAGLKVRFGDGARDLELEPAGHEVTGLELNVRLRDRHYPLEVHAHYRIFEDTDIIERSMELRHVGGPDDDAITVERADSARWVLPRRDDWRLSHAVGAWGAENQLRRDRLPVAETVLTSRRGVSSHQAGPWLMLDDGTAGEEHGEVWSSALAWSGSWRISAERTPAGVVTVTGGFGHDQTLMTLRPGETVTTPAFPGLYTAGGFGAASRAWHAYIRSHVLPRPEETRPVLFNSWEATGFDVDEAGQIRLAQAATALGAELFVMDDGWFGARTSDAAGLGDWYVNPDRFPNGLHRLIKEVRGLGMDFGLWVEPEMVNPDSELYRAHPDWVLHQPHRRRTLMRNQLVLNFARPDVAAWAHQWLDELLSRYDIDFLKWDMNRSFTEAGWPGAADPDRLWIDHTRAVYALIDRLRADHPRLRIECCASGGGRTDLGMLERCDQIWTSDNTDAVDRLTIQCGYSQIHPAGTMGAWVTDVPNQSTQRVVPLRFRFHVAMSGVLALGGDLPAWTQEELAQAAGYVEQYKRIRHLVQHGDLYRLGQGAVQYVAGDGSQVVVFVYAPYRPLGDPEPPTALAGLDADATYIDADTGVAHRGAALMTGGLPVRLPSGDYASAVVHLIRR